METLNWFVQAGYQAAKNNRRQMSDLKSAPVKYAGYRQNFVKVRKLIFFGPKCPNLGIWPQNFRKQM